MRTSKVTDVMLDRRPQDRLVAVALLIAAVTPDSKAAMVRIKRENCSRITPAWLVSFGNTSACGKATPR